MALVGDRRIEVVSGSRTLLAVDLDPVLSSAKVGWHGLLFEQHDSGTCRLVDAPEHFSSKHLLRLNTGRTNTSEWRINGRSRQTHDQPGAVSILPAGTHVSVVAQRSSCLVLEIDPLQLRQSGHTGSRDVELEVKLTIPDRQIELLMSAMQADLEAGSPAGALYGESLGNSLGTYLVKRFGVLATKLEEYKGGLPKARLNRVLEYVDQHLADNVSLKALAEVAGLSMYHFAKAFKQSTGAPPYQYVLEQKIERARQLLRDPDRSILEASARTGFVDQSHFTKVFHRLVGVTPTEYRNQT